LEEKKLKIKWNNKKARVLGDLTAILWKQNVYILTNIHCPPEQGNVCDEYGNALKPEIVQDYNRHFWYVDCKLNTYSTSRHI
jgi:hypothetical protein